ncbi:hypothetical protein ACKGJY_00490 [Hyunsoonleella sp. 2307UL5-6]|uniref:hypothetical protein n=1 Tax=Hyunsoonleella sp. 2307UL5-6 TaxID=3384768 RepID=UPI0039BCD545
MSVLDNIFVKKVVKSKQIFPNRDLKLHCKPIAENGRFLALEFVKLIKNAEGIDLNFKIESLKFVDEFLERYSGKEDVNNFAEIIFTAGCYCGQVMVENANGIWTNVSEKDMPVKYKMMPLVIKLPNGIICDPIRKAFKRFANGQFDSISYFYKVFTHQKVY